MKLQTNKLELRRFMKEDYVSAFAIFSDTYTMEMLGIDPVLTTLEQSKELIDDWSNYDDRLAIVLKETNQLVGYIAIHEDSEGQEDTREIGFATIPLYRKQGYMFEALNAVLTNLKQNNIKYVWACSFKGNIASEHLIQKLGFELMNNGEYTAENGKTYQSLEYRKTL